MCCEEVSNDDTGNGMTTLEDLDSVDYSKVDTSVINTKKILSFNTRI